MSHFIRKFGFLVILLIGTQAQASPESWYFHLGLGYGSPKYPAGLQSTVNEIKALGVTNTPTAVDIGFYWPADISTLVGISINGVSDAYKQGFEEVSIVQSGFFGSCMHFFGAEPGSGFFLRGDIGAGNIGVQSGGIMLVSNRGLGIIAGGGYGIPIGGETRLLLQATYSQRRVDGNSYGLTAFTVSGLF